MTKADYILHWKETSEQEWSSAQGLFTLGNYLSSLFHAHLLIEKLSKAHWVKDNVADFPPRTHNIIRLWQQTTLQPTPDQELVALELQTFQLEGRYPDYQRIAYQRATRPFTQALLNDTSNLRSWLLSSLP